MSFLIAAGTLLAPLLIIGKALASRIEGSRRQIQTHLRSQDKALQGLAERVSRIEGRLHLTREG